MFYLYFLFYYNNNNNNNNYYYYYYLPNYFIHFSFAYLFDNFEKHQGKKTVNFWSRVL